MCIIRMIKAGDDHILRNADTVLLEHTDRLKRHGVVRTDDCIRQRQCGTQEGFCRFPAADRAEISEIDPFLFRMEPVFLHHTEESPVTVPRLRIFQRTGNIVHCLCMMHGDHMLRHLPHRFFIVDADIDKRGTAVVIQHNRRDVRLLHCLHDSRTRSRIHDRIRHQYGAVKPPEIRQIIYIVFPDIAKQILQHAAERAKTHRIDPAFLHFVCNAAEHTALIFFIDSCCDHCDPAETVCLHVLSPS